MKNKRRTWIKSNDSNWYVVKYKNNRIELLHRTALSSILECGHDMEDYNILSLQKCGE